MALTLYGNAPVLFVYRQGDQAISAATNTTILYNTIVYDSDSMYDATTGKVTPKKAGYYAVGATTYYTSASTLTFGQIEGFSNGVSYNIYGHYTNGTATVQSMSWPCVYMNGSTDWFRIMGYAAAGDRFGGGAVHTSMQCILVRSAQ